MIRLPPGSTRTDNLFPDTTRVRSAADAVDWVVPHQANARILDATARKLGLAPEKVVVTVDEHANTSAASVPLALDTAVRDGRIGPGAVIVLEAMGGGLTWGAAGVRFCHGARRNVPVPMPLSGNLP